MTTPLERYLKTASQGPSGSIGLEDWNGLVREAGGLIAKLQERAAGYDVVATEIVGVLLYRVNEVLNPTFAQALLLLEQAEARYAEVSGEGISASSIIDTAMRVMVTADQRALIDELDEDLKLLTALVALKANVTDVNTALGLKANSAAVNTALGLKADATRVDALEAGYALRGTLTPTGATADFIGISDDDVLLALNGISLNGGSSGSLTISYSTNNGSSWVSLGSLNVGTLSDAALYTGCAAFSGLRSGAFVSTQRVATANPATYNISQTAVAIAGSAINGIRFATQAGIFDAGTVSLYGKR